MGGLNMQDSFGTQFSKTLPEFNGSVEGTFQFPGSKLYLGVAIGDGLELERRTGYIDCTTEKNDEHVTSYEEFPCSAVPTAEREDHLHIFEDYQNLTGQVSLIVGRSTTTDFNRDRFRFDISVRPGVVFQQIDHLYDRGVLSYGADVASVSSDLLVRPILPVRGDVDFAFAHIQKGVLSGAFYLGIFAEGGVVMGNNQASKALAYGPTSALALFGGVGLAAGFSFDDRSK